MSPHGLQNIRTSPLKLIFLISEVSLAPQIKHPPAMTALFLFGRCAFFILPAHSAKVKSPPVDGLAGFGGKFIMYSMVYIFGSCFLGIEPVTSLQNNNSIFYCHPSKSSMSNMTGGFLSSLSCISPHTIIYSLTHEGSSVVSVASCDNDRMLLRILRSVACDRIHSAIIDMPVS